MVSTERSAHQHLSRNPGEPIKQWLAVPERLHVFSTSKRDPLMLAFCSRHTLSYHYSGIRPLSDPALPSPLQGMSSMQQQVGFSSDDSVEGVDEDEDEEDAGQSSGSGTGEGSGEEEPSESDGAEDLRSIRSSCLNQQCLHALRSVVPLHQLSGTHFTFCICDHLRRIKCGICRKALIQPHAASRMDPADIRLCDGCHCGYHSRCARWDKIGCQVHVPKQKECLLYVFDLLGCGIALLRPHLQKMGLSSLLLEPKQEEGQRQHCEAARGAAHVTTLLVLQQWVPGESTYACLRLTHA
eukprot:scaffold127449_cov20-Tisochrysis_lutea.AAC.4